jgi:hypothetical protein
MNGGLSLPKNRFPVILPPPVTAKLENFSPALSLFPAHGIHDGFIKYAQAVGHGGGNGRILKAANRSGFFTTKNLRR